MADRIVPDRTNVLSLIGGIATELSLAQLHLEHMIHIYIHDDAGGVVLSYLGASRDKSDLLYQLCVALEKTEDAQKSILNAIGFYKITLENRNILLHSHAIDLDPGGEIRLWRSVAKHEFPYAVAKTDIQELNRVYDDAHTISKRMAYVFNCLAQHLGYRVFEGDVRLEWPTPLPSPEKLKGVEAPLLASSMSRLQKNPSPAKLE